LLKEATNSELPELKAPIAGSDRDPDILNQARINAQQCGVADQVTFTQPNYHNSKHPPTAVSSSVIPLMESVWEMPKN
jgi:putative N6-adenine-specific DNA methylase